MELKTHLDYYNDVIQSEQEWLANLQLTNGALPFRYEDNGTANIIPYFSDITAIALLQKAPDLEYTDVVTDYFEWYFAHLNDADADKNGVAGTIYNYSAEVLNGVVVSETTEQKYDSIDSYAALSLIALWEFYEQTGNADFIINHYYQIINIIGAMNGTIDVDGLSYVKPNYQIKYLMDNAEVYQGLSCASSLLEKVFLPHYNEGTQEYNDIKQMLVNLEETKDGQEKAFNTILWSETEQRYEIGIDNDGDVLNFCGWTEFYPDAVAQLFPILFGVIDTDSERARNLYFTFGQYFDWENMAHYENGDASFYWGLTAYCGALMLDEEKVLSYLDYYKNKVMPNHEYPAYNADVAWVVLACSKMFSYYQDQMQRVDPLGIIYLP